MVFVGFTCKCICVFVLFYHLFLFCLAYICFWDLTAFPCFLFFPPSFLCLSLTLSILPWSLSFSPSPLPSWHLLWGFTGCIFPVFFILIQCNFPFINIWFPLSELSSAQAADREMQGQAKKKKESTVFIWLSLPSFQSSLAIYLFYTVSLTLCLYHSTQTKFNGTPVCQIWPSACIK